MLSTSATQVQLTAPRSYVGWVSVYLNLIPRVFPWVIRFSSLSKTGSLPIPSGYGAVLQGHTMYMGRVQGPSAYVHVAGSTAPSVWPRQATPLAIQSLTASKGV